MTLERIITFSKSQQLLFLGSELERARVWEDNDLEKFQMALKRGLELLDLMMQDRKWQNQIHMLEFLNHEIKQFLDGKKKSGIGILYRAL